MTNVQEALNSAILDLEHAEEHANCDYGNSISKCKAALSEIDKCEPVIGLENGQILWSKMPSEYTGSLFTSPQPIEKCEPVAWQGLGICTLQKPVKDAHLFSPLYALPTTANSEPIAWMTNREDVIEQFGTMTITNAHKNSLVLAEQIIADLFDIPLYTSPQPRDCEDWQYFDKAYRKAAETSDATDWMNAALLAQQVRRKQLNTKG